MLNGKSYKMSIFANYKIQNMKLSHNALRGAAVIAVILTTVLLPSSCDDNVWRAHGHHHAV